MTERWAKARTGFTLIELMLVVTIFGILAAIAVPKFAALVRKANEGASKGSLGAIRSALNIYYGDNEGQFPQDPNSLTINGKYLAGIPSAKAPGYHPDFSGISIGCDTINHLPAPTDFPTGPSPGCLPSGGCGWAYDSCTTDSGFGLFVINCIHTDTKGSLWTTY